MEKHFALRTNQEIYDRLKAEAGKKKWSVNTLVNEILEQHQKKSKKKLAISK